MRPLLHIVTMVLSLVLVPVICAAKTSFSSAANNNQNASMNFMVIADIHFDPFTSCTTRPCPLIDKLRNAPAKDWANILAEYDKLPPQFRQDTNYPLLSSALAEFHKITSAQHAQFVLMLGDFIGHRSKYYYRRYSTDKSLSGYKSFIHKTLDFMTIELSKAFPDVDVFAAVGNNDSYQDDYVSDPGGEFFRDIASMWSGLVHDKIAAQTLEKEFAAAGYYAVTMTKQPDLRLIVLNTNLFTYRARGKKIDQAASAELGWLHNQLELAKEHKQKVMIAMHIPEGIDVYATLTVKLFTLMQLWKPDYQQRFESELQAYAPEITALLAAHLHSDWFQILTYNNTDQIPVIGTPSVSPIFGNNPGFKIFGYSPQARQLENYVTYYYPLNDGKNWGPEYGFNRINQGEHCSECPVTNGMSLSRENGTLADYYKMFFSTGTNSQLVAGRWNPHYWCAIWSVQAQDYKKCIN